MLTNSSLAENLRVSVGRLARRLRQQSLGGLTPSQSSLLSTLDRRGPMSMGRLAEIEGISRPSATGIVGRLDERGLVVRRSDPDDGRCAIVGITDEGVRLLDLRRKESSAYLARQIELLDEDERAALEIAAGLFERMIEGR